MLKVCFKTFLNLFLLLSVSRCGEIISSLEYSQINGQDLSWMNKQNISSLNISNYAVAGRCVLQLNDVTVSIGNPTVVQQVLPCINGFFNGVMDLSAAGLPEGPMEVSATQVNLSASALVQVIVDTIVPLAPTIITPANGSSTSAPNISVTGTCDTGNIINLFGDFNGSPLTTSCVGNAFARSVTLILGNGSKAINANQEDLVGNISPSDSVTITLGVLPVAPTITSPLNGSTTNITAQTIIGGCETGATVNLTGNIVGTPVAVLCVTSSYSQAVTLNGGQGLNTLNVTQTNGAGTSPSAILNINFDSLAPSAPSITSPASGSSTNTTAQTVIGACETGATVNISGAIVGTPVTASCVASSYTRAVTLTAVDGAKAISATQTDVALNTSAATNISVTLDTTAPSAPTITSPLNGSLTNSTAQTIIGACETGATVNISGAIVGSPVTTICAASSYSRAVTLTAANGAKAISATQTDVSNNTSAATNISITYDNVAPAAPTITSPANGSTTSSTAQTVIGACENGATVNISGAIVGSPVTASCVASAYSRAVTLTAANGAKAISATQTDVALNTSAATNISITYDNVAPSAPTITSPANGSFTNSTAQTVVGACETGATVNISGAIVGSPVTASCVASAYSRAVTLTPGDGAKAISATQTDVSLNTSAATNISVTLDTTAPSAPTITSPTNGSSTNTTAQTIVGTCETGATVNISGAIVGSPVTASCVASSYSRAVTLTAANGAKAISATQTDVANNTSSATNISITYDNVAPSAPTITSPANGSSTNTTAQTIIGACETGATVNISGAIIGSPVTTVCAASAYSRAVTLTAGDGAKAISATQTDVALNTSAATNISITLDTANPAPPTIVTPVNGTTTSSSAQTVSGACETGTTLEIWGNLVGSPLFTTCAASSYSLGVTLTAAFAAKTINVHQTDPAGNTSTPVAVTINYTNLNVTYPATFTGPKYTPLNFPAAGIARTLISGTPTGYSIAPALPTGLTINATSGLIAGTPNISDDTGKTYTITITDGSATITRSIFIRIAIPDYTWMGTAGDGLWTTAANWKAAAVPPLAAFTYFDDECLVSGFCNVNINANVQVQRVYMKPTYTGTMTQNAGRTFQVGDRNSAGAVSDSWGKWIMESGTFVGGNSDITAERVNIQGGTFTSTSGTLRLGSVYTWKDCYQIGPSWDTVLYKDCGFTLSATAAFNHNNGIVHVNSVNSTSGTYLFLFWLDQPLNIRNYIFDLNTNSGPVGFDNRHNSAISEIQGISKIINVSDTLDWRDGSSNLGEIRYQGLDANFECDAISGSNRCGDFTMRLETLAVPENITYVGISAHTWIKFNRNDGTPQTYTFDDGAAAPGFIIENPNGVNPVPTGVAQYFRLGKLKMNSGVFSAPQHLSFGEGSDTRYSGSVGTDDFGVYMNGGGFAHNNGLVSFDSKTDNDDNRNASIIEAQSGVTFYDLELNIEGDRDLNGAEDRYGVYITPGSVVNILGELRMRNGRFESQFPTFGVINVHGNLNFMCSNPAQKNCYSMSYVVDFRLVGNSANTQLSFQAGGPGFLAESPVIFTINKTLQSHRVTLIGNGGLSSNGAFFSQFNLTSGIFDIGTYQFDIASDFVNNGAVQCTVGTGYFQYLGVISGTPVGGNQPLCYGP